MSRSWRISVPLLILLASPRLAFLQTTMGTITGLVTDSTGAVVPGATVEARNLDTGGESKTTTSATGNYSLPGLRVGHYRGRLAARVQGLVAGGHYALKCG